MMQRNVVPLGGTVLGVGLLGQAQDEPFERFPIWIWILLAAVVIAVAVIWTLREEGEEAAGTEAEAQPAPPAAPAKAEVTPAPEPAATPAPEAVDAEPAAAAAAGTEVVEEVETPEVPAVDVSGAPVTAAATADAVTEVAEEVEPPEPPSRAGDVDLAEPEAPVAAAPSVAPPTPVEPDDLKVVEGIGPKSSGVLQSAGISTFAQLANTDVEQLRQILVDADLTRLADPGTWPEQAALAAAGDWDGLQALQDSLKGGRRV